MEDNKEKYDLYDSIVMTVMKNVLVERERCGKFILYDFTPETDADKLYFNVAAIAADLNREKLYLDMPLCNYIKFRRKRGKKRTNLRWFNPFQKKRLSRDYKTSVFIIMNFIASQLHISFDLFKEINDAYYGWVE